MNRKTWSLLCVVLMVVGIAGCGVMMVDSGSPKASSAGGGSGAYTHVIVGDTDYYRNSPSQSSPSDGSFVKGTKVTLVRKAGSYSLVRSVDGVEAYVSTGSIRAAN